MSVLLATHLDTTQGKAARYGTTTTTWKQEHPGLWVATRDGKTVAALHLGAASDDDSPSTPIQTLEQARHAHITAASSGRATPPIPSAGLSSTSDRLRSALRPLGLAVMNALHPAAT